MNMRSVMVVLVVFLGIGSSTWADMFGVTVNDKFGNDITVTGSDLTTLVKNLIDTQDQFSNVDPDNANAQVTYAGVPQAIKVDLVKDPATGLQTAQVEFPSTGYKKTFSAPTQDAVETEVEDWVKKEGSKEYSKFLQKMNGQTKLAQLDGNPRATTAVLARNMFNKFGMGNSLSRTGYDYSVKQSADYFTGRYAQATQEGTATDTPDNLADVPEPVEDWGAFEIRFDGGAATINTEGKDNLYTAWAALTFGAHFSKHFGMALSVPVQYRDYEGTMYYDAGVQLALPITFIVPEHDFGWYWRVTPFAQLGAGASLEAAAGGAFYGGGVTNQISWNIWQFQFTMGNQLSYTHGLPVEFDEYKFETELEQLIMTNGLKVAWFPAEWFFVEGGCKLSNFLLGDAALKSYYTPFAGIGVQWPDHLIFRIGAEGDYGEDYTSMSAVAKLDFYFH